MMPLCGNNRILVKIGLEMMSCAPRPGIQALIRTARIRSPRLRSDHIAYQLAPRLNAAGRMSDAKEAFDLLMAKSRSDAERLALNLDRLSSMRRSVEDEVLEEVRRRIGDTALGEGRTVVVAGDGWHRGVLGIVAARLGELTGRPVYLVSFEGHEGIGSGRGQGQIDLYHSLCAASEHLVRFGGHHDAVGFTLSKDRLEVFTQSVEAYAKDNWKDASGQELVCDAALKLSDLTPELVSEIERLGPFGEGFSQPVFAISEIYVLDRRVVGQDHLKLDLKLPSGTIAAFGPRMGAYAQSIPHVVSMAVNLTVDEWRGSGQPELRLVAPPSPLRERS
jgi:single-stranded-DNA-specific exonuclease